MTHHIQDFSRQKAGFSLVEIAVVVAVIGILVALAIPAYKRSQDSTRIATIENDLRIYEQNFETFELENKFFPPSQPIPGQFPDGMAELMPDTWKLPSPIGGTYRWVYTTEEKPSDRSAYIEIVNSPANPILISAERLREIDDDMDDGNTSTGQFILNGLNIRYYIRF
ncbi:hypothetical protein DDZ13_06180 [Coraliomargarita sinensis]|uniref:Type II secretion system protein GspG C-terminal domain-containing protein n=1 Tax=Coraliomargarita sinensis TaxID=2174842 RepID=A0A317ZGI1_9BACT|nr:prepilin-type N-terminal cleavage/methylation domain-containing protein [Coraliomargarita sinensis]PXA04754.1 hypothetical protein DDZ13_06180 [Coraliomargarita sinensis]